MAGDVPGVGGAPAPSWADAGGTLPGESAPVLPTGDALDALAFVASESLDVQLRSQGERAADAVKRIAAERREKAEATRKALAAREDAGWWHRLTIKAGVVGAAGTLVGQQTVVAAAAVTAAYSTLRSEQLEADATGHEADAALAGAEAKHAEDLRDDAIEGASSILDLERRVMELAAQVDQSRAKASLTAAKA